MMRDLMNILNEADLFEKTHELYTAVKDKVIIVESPSPQHLHTMLERYHDLRGLIDDQDNCYIWEAMKMTHYNVEMGLGLVIETGFYLRELLSGKIAVRWEDYSGNGKSPEGSASFARMMRRDVTVIGKTEAVYNDG